MGFWEHLFGRRLPRSRLAQRKPKRRRGKGMGGEPVIPSPPGPLPSLTGGAAVALDDDPAELT